MLVSIVQVPVVFFPDFVSSKSIQEELTKFLYQVGSLLSLRSIIAPLRPKKSSFASGSRPGENVSISHTLRVSEYILLISKNIQTSKNNNKKKQEYKKTPKKQQQKKLKKKREYFRKTDLRKINLRPPGRRFFSSLAFLETRVFFFA